ncbi:MAG TPA: NADP-dependent phosphogluconate dehydrogenase [Bacteroidales bacterium]|nr:NADP-dependent phosphogluconate dehydrogenase [Bacteroidales bacterium]
MKQECEIGIVGLGVMGQNFLQNLADNGFSVAGYDLDINKVNYFQTKRFLRIYATGEIDEFVKILKQPRAIMLLVPAGNPVDSAINSLVNHLQPGDIIIDAGNSYYKDTDRRRNDLSPRDIQFMGTGISGGEEGARNGPSIMPGGNEQAWERVRPLFEAAAAKVDGIPCVSLLGSGSSGHFVKMVHNGIEYGIMQLIAETYDIMKRGLNLNDDQLYHIYSRWNESEVNSYLVGITADIFTVEDEENSGRLINRILDVSGQKGTGMWTSQSAMELHVPVPTIDAAVMMRNLSTLKEERQKLGRIFRKNSDRLRGDNLLRELKDALYAGMLITYAQGLALLSAASEEYKYGLKLKDVAQVWKGGCIIRSDMLNDISDAFSNHPDLSNILFDRNISQNIIKHVSNLREVISYASEIGLPVPSMMSSLTYLDALSSEWLPANLIQAQRDYFGAHTFERIDKKGTFHANWLKAKVHENFSH